jgi:hypothetical protein
MGWARGLEDEEKGRNGCAARLRMHKNLHGRSLCKSTRMAAITDHKTDTSPLCGWVIRGSINNQILGGSSNMSCRSNSGHWSPSNQAEDNQAVPRFDWLRAVNLAIDWRTGRVMIKEEEAPLTMRVINEDAMPNYKKEFPMVFSEDEFRGLPPQRKWDHVIDLEEGHQPPRGKCYPLAAKEKEALRKFIGDNIQDKRIRKSSSPYASPFFFRPKQGTTEL